MSFRLAFRSLRRQPGFSLIAVLTLALGIGATTAIFTVVDAVLLRPLPFPEADRVVVLQERAPKFPNPISLSVLNFPDLRDQARSFEAVGAWRNVTMNLTGGDEPVRLTAKMLSADVLTTLRTSPMIGRAFTSDDDKAGAEPVAIVSYALWQSRLGGATSILNTTIQLDGRPVTVVGVMPASFRDSAVRRLRAAVAVALGTTEGRVASGAERHRAHSRQRDACAGTSGRGADQYQLEGLPEANLQTRFLATPALQLVAGMLILVAAVAGVLLVPASTWLGCCSRVVSRDVAKWLCARRSARHASTSRSSC
jgi:hypothetical protein